MHGTAQENAKYIRAIVPDQHGVGTVNGTGIDCKGFREAAFFLDAGDVGTSATVDFKVQESDVVGSGYADVTGAAITQITTDNKWAVVRLNLENRKRFLRGVLTVGVAASEAAVACVLSNPIEKPVTQPTDTEVKNVA
jgi:hypothetical protein